MTPAGDLDSQFREELGDRRSGWSMGAFGALAEFTHLDDEATEFPGAFTAVNRAGAIRIALPAIARVHAFEALAANARVWQQGIVFGLPNEARGGAMRSAVTELGPDPDAIRAQDRGDLLFDLGLGIHSCEFLVRTADPSLVSVMRRLAGRALFADERSSLEEIRVHHPHRVVRTPLGRIEVFQRIGEPHGETPAGPHTHLLPDLVLRRRFHAADLPIPGTFTPGLFLHPANPVCDEHGKPLSFDSGDFVRFQKLLDRFGDPALTRLKHRVWSAVRDGEAPMRLPAKRAERIACRVALRQLAHLDGDSAVLSAWRQAMDAGALRRASKRSPATARN